ncbi:alpha-hydroxy acid oxidase [Nonomuraea sp. NPDC049400]|uniref:alpha-hydroxy acid oxidase n=1 Tax=Nonomuraea sp. NPDC049400 TaxID=3364352 RepID=UPI0037BBEEB6
MPHPASARDYSRLARGLLPRDVWDYVNGGAGDEWTLAANRRALRRAALRPRVLVDVGGRDTRVRVMGAEVAAPIGVAPMAYHRLVHPEGETATVRAAGDEGLVTVVSTFASRTIEEIAAAARGPLWFQLYCFRDRAITADLIGRAESAGCRALVLTGDTPLLGRRDRDVRHGFTLPEGVTAANLRPSRSLGSGLKLADATADLLDPAVTWSVIDWLRGLTGLPILIKGVLTAEDAALAVRAGASGVIVSNHGGRQADGAIGALDALEEVVDRVGADAEVHVDGGIRRGADVVKALALGARMVFVGRPVLWGLAVSGEVGVREVLRMLKDELDLTMALCGCPAVRDISRDRVRLSPPGGREWRRS